MPRKAWSLLILIVVMLFTMATGLAADTTPYSPEPTPEPTPEPMPEPDGHAAQEAAPAVGDNVVDTLLEFDGVHKHAQHGPSEGHLLPSSKNVELVGQLTISDAEPGRIGDVAALGNYTYLAAFREPECERGGVYIVDISDPANPQEVGFIPTAPGNYVSEGMQVIHLDTPSFQGDVLVHNNEICNETASSIGGVSLWDVTNPLRPLPLAWGQGDTVDPEGNLLPRANQIHSAFAWQAGEQAFVVLVDDEERLSVDILDITDPFNPVMIAETGLPDWPDAQDEQAEGMGTFPVSVFHDVVVKQIDGNWRMLLSYWDAGWIILDVNDPANPVFIEDSTYPDPDTLTGFSPPEGNAHQAEWSFDNQFIVGTDEDFDPFRVVGRNTSEDGQFQLNPGSDTPPVEPGRPISGQTVFVGRACNDDPAVPAGDGTSIAVTERGVCPFTEKVANVEAAGGYIAVLVMNREGPDACNELVNMGVEGNIPALSIGRDVGFDLFDTPFDLEACLAGEGTQQAPIAIGTTGDTVTIESLFDGWGYVRLLDAQTLEEIDAYAIDEALDRRYARDFGDLTVHEVATDPETNLAYFSWYAGGFRVAKFGEDGIEEVGHYIAEGGNNFWGVEVHSLPDDPTGEKLILASDRDSGLWIFRYTGK
jgi:hypothetical protein